jgi:hypothetical protein
VEATYTTVASPNVASATLLHKIRTSTLQASNGAFYINQVGNGVRNPMLHGTGMTGGVVVPNLSNAWQDEERVYTGFRLFASTGNLTANVSVYGLAKS